VPFAAAVTIMAAVFMGSAVPARVVAAQGPDIGVSIGASILDSTSASQRADDSRSAPSIAWRQIPGGPGTGCAEGAPFSYFVHSGDPRRVLVVLDGGGACWNPFTCVEHPTFTAAVDSTVDPGRLYGVLDLDRADNPFHGFTVVRVPYCTGDVHLGRRDAVYQVTDSSGSVTQRVAIHHGGNANVEDALRWMYRSGSDPSVVVVVGLSAGAVATPFYAAELARHFGRARIVSLGDGAGGYHAGNVSRTLSAWNTAGVLRADSWYRGMDSSHVTTETITARAARGAPRVRYAQVNAAEDSVQVMFLKLLGVKQPRVDSLMAVSFREIRRSVPGLRTYTTPGPMHTVLTRPEFYTVRAGGVSLRDWVAALVAGKPVQNVGDALLQRALQPRGSPGSHD